MAFCNSVKGVWGTVRKRKKIMYNGTFHAVQHMSASRAKQRKAEACKDSTPTNAATCSHDESSEFAIFQVWLGRSSEAVCDDYASLFFALPQLRKSASDAASLDSKLLRRQSPQQKQQ